MRILSRRRLVRVFQVPGLVILPLVFFLAPGSSVAFVQWGIFLVGMMTLAPFRFLGNYLPRVYPVHLRGTGESFAANVGGRMIGTSAALITTQLVPAMPGQGISVQLAYAAAAVGTTVYLVGFVAGFWLPEPGRDDPPE